MTSVTLSSTGVLAESGVAPSVPRRSRLVPGGGGGGGARVRTGCLLCVYGHEKKVRMYGCVCLCLSVRLCACDWVDAPVDWMALRSWTSEVTLHCRFFGVLPSFSSMKQNAPLP